MLVEFCKLKINFGTLDQSTRYVLASSHMNFSEDQFMMLLLLCVISYLLFSLYVFAKLIAVGNVAFYQIL